MNKNTRLLILGGLFLIAAVLYSVINMMPDRARHRSRTNHTSDKIESAKESAVKSDEDITSPTLSTQEKPVSLNSQKQPKKIAVLPDKTPFDPEKQPRKFFAQEFVNLSSLPDGYKVDNLKITDKGIELPPAKEGEEDKPRSGMLESPSIPLDFPSNAVSPLWKSEEPDDSTVLVELAMSPDGENWGMWHSITIDDDAVDQISDVYPDGRPNPNYGYTPGGVLCWGMKQYQYFRYRVTLYSEGSDSPLLSGFRIFYQDSTLGEGHIAEVNQENTQ